MDGNRLEIGDVAPDFELPDADGNIVRLKDLGRVLIYVYPAAMTPGCTTETCDFNAAAPDFDTAGMRIVGLSPDSPEKLAKFRDKYGIEFPLLSDESKETLTAYGAFGEKKNYGKTVMGVIRSTFVVEEDGTLSFARYNVRAKGHVAMVAGLLDVDLSDTAAGE
ncbi:peroxiredoxin [Dietzia sp.]|uniref:peroxiredoxin n=1 Tax=Dietzia sp. TaxID=1871616 RepID=UPI002FDAC2A6